VRSTAAPYTESRLAHLVRNKCVGFPVVEQKYCNYNVQTQVHAEVLEAIHSRVRVLKLLRSLGIDSKELVPPWLQPM
jgi:hypothetical protein